MQDAKEAKQRKSGWRGKIHSLRVQVGLMILISYVFGILIGRTGSRAVTAAVASRS